MSKYPDNWADIRDKILLRAGGRASAPSVGARCEWCRVENYTIRVDGAVVANCESYGEAAALKRRSFPAGAVVVLTIAHVSDPAPANTSPDNLAALCQKCHNRHDAPMRRQNAAKTRRRKRMESGQMRLI